MSLFHRIKVAVLLSVFFAVGANAQVIKCAFKENNSGLLYIAMTEHSVNFHFVANANPFLPVELDTLLSSQLGLFNPMDHAHGFEFAMPRKNCTVSPTEIALECKAGPLMNPAWPQLMNEAHKLVNHAMPGVTDAEVKLSEQISPLGTLEHRLELTLSASLTQKTGAMAKTLDCIQ